jgi:hypothetical protein
MQSNHYRSTIKKVYPRLLQVLKYPVAMACMWYVYLKVSTVGWQLPEVDVADLVLLVVIQLLLMPINWLLEAKRWQVSVPFEPLTFRQALNTVLRGLTLNLIVPFSLGDVGGRLVGRKHQGMSMVAIGINRFTMLLITLTYGGAAFLFYFHSWQLYLLALLFAVVLFVFAAKRNLLGQHFAFIDTPLIIRVSVLTLLRYLVFTVQFYLFLAFFNPELPFHIIFLGIGWVFLFRTITPSLLGSIGVREASAMVFFEAYVPNISQILVPCLLIWLINTILPSIAGIVPILTYKQVSSN